MRFQGEFTSSRLGDRARAPRGRVPGPAVKRPGRAGAGARRPRGKGFAPAPQRQPRGPASPPGTVSLTFSPANSGFASRVSRTLTATGARAAAAVPARLSDRAGVSPWQELARADVHACQRRQGQVTDASPGVTGKPQHVAGGPRMERAFVKGRVDC